MPSEDSFTIKLDTSGSTGANLDYAALKELTTAIKELSGQIRRRPTSTENDVARMARATRTTESVQQRINRVTGIDNYRDISRKEEVLRGDFYSRMINRAANREQVEQRRAQREQERVSRGRMRTMAAGGALGTYLADRYIQAGGQIGTALASANPLANNYDYGSSLANIMNLKQQQANAIGTGVFTGAGYALGGPIGGAIGGAASTVFNSLGTAETSQRAASSAFIYNNMMRSQAFTRTNTGASPTDYGLSDVRNDLERSMAKSTQGYNQNFKELKKLTDYIVAAQIPISMAPALGAQMARATMVNRSFTIGTALNTFAAYDVANPVEAMATTNSLMGAGFSEKEATILASRIQNSFMGQAQGQAIGSFLSQSPISMDVENQVFKQLTGKSAYESLNNGNKFFRDARSYEKAAAEGRLKPGGKEYNQLMMARMLSSEFNIPLETLAYGTGASRKVDYSKDLTKLTPQEQKIFDTLSGNEERSKYASKNTPTAMLDDLADASGGAAGALHQFAKTVEDVTGQLGGLISEMRPATALSDLISPLLPKNTKSGNTGSKLGSRRSP